MGWWMLGHGYEKNPEEVKIGYFHGGRTMLLYRAFINGEFDSLNLKLVTKDLGKENYYEVTKSFEDTTNNENYGKVRGGELIDEVVAGRLDGATVGESSFIKAVLDGKPVVAVALLGFDSKERPAHAILMRTGVKVDKPLDLKGKKLITRRAGDGDETFLREYLVQQGLDPDKDVKLVTQVDDREWVDSFVTGDFDGGYFHEMAVEQVVGRKEGYVLRKLDWVNPVLSQAVLVFHKDFLKRNPERVKKILKVYVDRIYYEYSLTKEQRTTKNGEELPIGLKMETDFMGMGLPVYREDAYVSSDLLIEMCNLLAKHEKVSGDCEEISKFIDNKLVSSVLGR